jgi:hypothetical protein
LTKYRNGKTLTREDIVALINKTKLESVQGNGKNMKEISLQWDKQKHRIDVFTPPKDMQADLLALHILPVVDGVIVIVPPIQPAEEQIEI